MKATFNRNTSCNAQFGDIKEFDPSMDKITERVENDYEKLKNLPQINSTVLIGNVALRSLGLRAIYYDTTANWNANPSMIAEEGALYIYKDARVEYDGVGNPTFIAGMKIGDGTSYLIDMPFVTDSASEAMIRHMEDTSIHITPEERIFWNNKVTSVMDETDGEILILTKDNI